MTNTNTLTLTSARLVDARGVVAENTTIEIEGSAITAIGDVIRSNGPTVDVAGLTVCPGLMNAHTHMCLDASTDPQPRYAAEPAVTMAVHTVERLRETVSRGVTTIRDLGGKESVILPLARLAAQGGIVSPRIVAAGSVITMTGGHGHWMGTEVDGIDAARRATRRLIKKGVGVIKVMATAGMMTAGQVAGAAQLTEEEMTTCVEEAHKAGIPVAAHVEGLLGARNAINAGVDSIEHGHGLEEPELLAMRQKGISLVPTIACDRIIVSRGRAEGIPDFVVDDCARLAPSLERALRQAIELGVRVAAGNDGGAPLTPAGDIVSELEVYVEMGMSPQQALASATIDTARLFRLDNVGLIDVGQRADLIVAQGDPLTSISALRDPVLVIAAGRIVPTDNPNDQKL